MLLQKISCAKPRERGSLRQIPCEPVLRVTPGLAEEHNRRLRVTEKRRDWLMETHCLLYFEFYIC